MNTKSHIAGRTALAASLALCFGGTAFAQDASAPADNTHLPPAQEQHGAPPTNWNDTFVGYRYSSNFHFPGSAAKVAQNIGSLTSTGGFGLGSYYFNVDYLQSDRNNPEASPEGVSGVGTHGANETYSVGHVEWSASKILHQHVGFGFVRDLGLTTGYEWGTKDDQFEQRAKMWMLGLTAEFAVPGYWNLTVGARNEQNYNGITGVDLHYKTAWHVDSAWMIPISGAPVPLVFKGFVAVTGPKGGDGFNVATNVPEKTTTETLLRTSLLVDVGSLIGHPKALYIGPGYEYWNHMFGAPSQTGSFDPQTFQTTTVANVGIKRSAAVFVAEAHF
jgi:nucleoside-specific outer membrane channel protein Tsx